MTGFTPANQFPTHHVPLGHGQSLIEPPLDRLPNLVLQSHQTGRTTNSKVEFCGVSLPEFRKLARRSVISLARKYTTEYRTENLPDLTNLESLVDRPIVMSGHQPDLFHCGVWFKNFLLSELAQASGAIGIHFLVDNDVCRSTNIQIPQLADSRPSASHCNDPDCTKQNDCVPDWSLRSVEYDDLRPAAPWENCRLQNLDTWNSFADRLLGALPAVDGEPLIAQLWEYAKQGAGVGQPLGEVLSRARHRMEADFGLSTLEVPLSRITETEEFARFSVQLLSELPRLHQTYNAALDDYRAAHRIRNHAQPLPNLASADDGWLEAPWWVYRPDSQTRDPMWIKKVGHEVFLSNRSDWQSTIDVSGTCLSAAAQWIAILRSGVCLRPRALLTTMFARLILSDLFIHGVGGARYDQLTDRIIADFFGLTAPPLVLASITLHLPFRNLDKALAEPVDEQLVQWQQKLRVAQSSPEAALSDPNLASDGGSTQNALAELKELLAQKNELLANIPPKGEKWEWHNKMKAVNERLAALAEPNRNKIKSRIEWLECFQKEQAIVLSRDFSFCLFPQETVADTFNNQIGAKVG